MISERPQDLIALNWGYEADHPFQRETRTFSQANLPFYVCPGTSTWQTMIGRNDHAFANLRAAAHAGKRNGAIGYPITDWGDALPALAAWAIPVEPARGHWQETTV